MRVDVDKFLTEVNRMFERHAASGTVYVTMKRSNEQPPKSKADLSGITYGCLVRATDGKRKVSTLLHGMELAKFQDAYATILRAHMHALKKRERARGTKLAL